jgi:hypothetical protein
MTVEEKNKENLELIVRHPEEEFEAFVRTRLEILSRFKNEAEIRLHLEALDEGKKLLSELQAGASISGGVS